MKKIKRELFSFDKYDKIMLFLAKLISMLKNKLLTMRNISNIKEIVIFKAIIQETIFNRIRDNNNYNYSQLKNIEFFKH